MIEIKRYEWDRDGGMCADPAGEYVEYEDFDRVTAERDQLKSGAIEDFRLRTELMEQYNQVTAERDAALRQVETITADRDSEKKMKAKARIQRDVQTAKATDLQQRLTAADERAHVLEGALHKIKARLDAYAEADIRMPEPSVEVCLMIADAALKPAEGADYRKSCEVAHKALSMENQRIIPARFKCLACGEYHEGSGNLPCPSMSPYSRIKQ